MSTKPNISAYILCGGKSSRMQTEKGLVHYNNKPFIKWIIEAVAPITKSIFLVTDNQDYAALGYPLIPDVYKAKGPVGGIFSALNHSDDDYNLILSCDVPNISTSVIQKYLINNKEANKDVTFLSDDDNIYPLIAIYNKRIASKFLEVINYDKLKLVSLLRELECQKIKVKTEDFRALKNINTKEELEILENKEKEISTK